MKATLKDVAREAGLSVTTVSRALNGHNDVAEETKRLVQEAADSLGYSPNLSARRLKTQYSRTIGLILPVENLHFSNPFFSSMFGGIVEYSAEHGYELNVTTPKGEESVTALYSQYIRGRRVDGFIVVRVDGDDERIALLQELEFPFVAFGHTPGVTYPYVDDDGAAGIQAALAHLVELGHHRIAFISEPRHLAKAETRYQGYLQGLAAHGLPYDPELVVEGNFRQRSGRLSAVQLLALTPRPTAIVTANDLVALGAMNAAHEQGLVIGRDISITGFDDIMVAEYANPPLTTLNIPANNIGRLLCQKLIQLIQGKSLAEPQTVIQPTLMVRQSTGPVL